RSLTALNQRIIEQMDMGAMVIDGGFHIRLINAAARRLLQLSSPPQASATLALVSPQLHDAVNAWLRLPGEQARGLEVNGRALLATFAVLPAFDDGSVGTTPILIFLEDAQRQAKQAQQLKL